MPPPGRAAGPGVGSLPALRRGTDPVHRPLQQGPGVRHGVSAGRAGRHPSGGDGAEGRRAAGPVSGGAAAVLCGRDPGPEPAVSVLLPESGVRLCRRAAPGAAPGIHRAGGRVRLPEYGAVRKALSTRRKGRRRDPGLLPGAVHGGLCLRRDGVPDPGPDGGPAGRGLEGPGPAGSGGGAPGAGGAAAVRGPFRAESRPQGFRTGNRVVLPGPHRGDTLPCQGGQEIRPVRLGAAGTAAP